MKNYYYILGISKDSGQEEIKKAFKLNILKLHPDRHNGDKFFEDKIKEINEAYDVLSDVLKRKEYDLRLNAVFISSDGSIRKREQELRVKEKMLEEREKLLLKKEKSLALRLSAMKRNEEELTRQKEELTLKKVANDPNYVIIPAPVFNEKVRNVFVKKWLKTTGEQVKAGEIIVRVQSDRAENMDVTSNVDGFIIYTAVGEKVPVGGTLAIISK